jgi:hypothetical protein
MFKLDTRSREKIEQHMLQVENSAEGGFESLAGSLTSSASAIQD